MRDKTKYPYTIYTIPKELITTDFGVVREAMRHFHLESLRLKWSWKEFCFVYAYKYDFWGEMAKATDQIQIAWLKFKNEIAKSQLQ